MLCERDRPAEETSGARRLLQPPAPQLLIQSLCNLIFNVSFQKWKLFLLLDGPSCESGALVSCEIWTISQ